MLENSMKYAEMRDCPAKINKKECSVNAKSRSVDVQYIRHTNKLTLDQHWLFLASAKYC